MKCHNCKFRAVLTTDEPCVDCKYCPLGTADYFEPAELKVLTAEEWFYDTYGCEDDEANKTFAPYSIYAYNAARDNWRLEMWLEFKKYLDDRKYVGMPEISAPLSLELAVKHLKPSNK